MSSYYRRMSVMEENRISKSKTNGKTSDTNSSQDSAYKRSVPIADIRVDQHHVYNERKVTAAASIAAPSNMISKKIRQQIIKSDEIPSPVIVQQKEPHDDPSARRLRLQRNRQRLNNHRVSPRSPSPATSTVFFPATPRDPVEKDNQPMSSNGKNVDLPRKSSIVRPSKNHRDTNFSVLTVGSSPDKRYTQERVPADTSTRLATSSIDLPAKKRDVTTPTMQKALTVVRSPRNIEGTSNSFPRSLSSKKVTESISQVTSSRYSAFTRTTEIPTTIGAKTTMTTTSVVGNSDACEVIIVDDSVMTRPDSQSKNRRPTQHLNNKNASSGMDSPEPTKKHTNLAVNGKATIISSKLHHPRATLNNSSTINTLKVHDVSVQNERPTPARSASVGRSSTGVRAAIQNAMNNNRSMRYGSRSTTSLTPTESHIETKVDNLPKTKSTAATKVYKPPFHTRKSNESPILNSTTSTSVESRDEAETQSNSSRQTTPLFQSHDFAAEISRYTATHITPRVSDVKDDDSPKDVSVYCRKRPLFDHEKDKGDYDIVRVQPGGTITLFRTKMDADMQTKSVLPVEYHCTAAFGDIISSETVYRRSVQSLVQLAMDGGKATVIMFGQAGSGKTYTMTAIERLAFSQIFAKGRMKDIIVQVQYLELCGNICNDCLISDNNVQVKLRDANDGSVRFVNAASIAVDGSEQLLRIVDCAKQRRLTEALNRSTPSNRSHGLCQMTMTHENGRRGVLTLVDCAGTESKHDSVYHSKDHQAESTEIDASLYALNECLRARSKKQSGVQIPYRSSLLTRILKESLESDRARLAIIATISPNARDFEHTRRTLNTVTSLMNCGCDLTDQNQEVLQSQINKKLPSVPKSWTHDELMQWLIDKHLLGDKVVPESVTGRVVMRMSKLQLCDVFYKDYQIDRADRLFQLLRAESDRIGRLELKRRMARGSPISSSMSPIRW